MDNKECPCPACGFYAGGEDGFGTYDICPICHWEDDGLQLANPACGGGANVASLIEAQMRVLQFLPPEVQEHGPYKRDPMWRPLNGEEMEAAENEANQERWMHNAILGYSEVYWAKRK